MMKKTDKPIYLEVYFDEDQDITETFEQLLKSEDFKLVIKTELLDRVYHAIKEGKEEFALFRLMHYSTDFVVDKKQYKKLLGTILSLYEQEEDYLKCVEIKNVIDKL